MRSGAKSRSYHGATVMIVQPNPCASTSQASLSGNPPGLPPSKKKRRTLEPARRNQESQMTPDPDRGAHHYHSLSLKDFAESDAEVKA